MKQQGGTFSITIPCKITYEWWPEEKATEFEPRVDEEFNLTSMQLGDLDIVDYLDCYRQTDVEVDFMRYLKEHKDEP